MAERTRIRIVAGPEWKRVADALREIDATLPRKLRKDIRDKVKPLVQQAKAKERAIPIHGAKQTGLRRMVARGVGIRVGVGKNAYVRVTTRVDDPSKISLPRHLDNPSRGWVHPTFGHPPEVRQHTGDDWFMDTFRHGKDDMVRGIHQVLEDAAQFIADQGHGP